MFKGRKRYERAGAVAVQEEGRRKMNTHQEGSMIANTQSTRMH
jgi:hypothetical protein